MPNKKKVLIQGIKKLLSLKVPNEEIIENLSSLGVGREQAKQLIEEAKHPEKFQKPAPVLEEEPMQELEEEAEEENADEKLEALGGEEEKIGEEIAGKEKKSPLEMLEDTILEKPDPSIDDIASGITGEDPEAKPKKEKKKKQVVMETEEPKQETASAKEFAEIWRKGIVTMIDQKLDEMKEIESNVEKKLKGASQEIAKKEIDKIKVLFDSQRALTMGKIDAKLDGKAKEVDQMLEAKITELRSLTKAIKTDVARLEKIRMEQKAGLEEIKNEIKELEETKSSLIAEMNSDLIKSKSSIAEFLDLAEKKIPEIEGRITKTLELESEIIESLVKNAESKIEEIVEKKLAEKLHRVRS
ncbi:MAG: hypothetical protein JW772_02960 [Candidatus Diapherotrites archaeon]|nr:hypothetical protein [Candidatus Diapherotrites archaeon]